MLHYLPEAISTFGPDIDRVMRFIYWVGGAWFLVAEAILFWAIFTYRKKDGVRAAWLPGDTLRSASWVLGPAAAVLACDLIIEAVSTPVWVEIKEDVPAADVLVRVEARQFTWVITYAGPDGTLGTADDFTSPDLRVPVGKKVRMQLESADVLHAFWSPELRLKQDVIPGRSVPAWFEPTKTGTYTVACAELCGKSHTFMQTKLVVDTVEAFDAWLAQQTPG